MLEWTSCQGIPLNDLENNVYDAWGISACLSVPALKQISECFQIHELNNEIGQLVKQVKHTPAFMFSGPALEVWFPDAIFLVMTSNEPGN